MDEWQPIETAPRDGTRVLLFQDGKRTEIGAWLDTSTEHEELVRRDGKRAVYEIVVDESGYWDGAEEIFAPTHWMPIPAPPSPSPSFPRNGDR